ncbi:hypothetical protein [Peterkaempfera griseoplana]|uniref:hypothetical protein n=1 Tax=Peterkaempfera griseoplana TaxID=66896 RepID=UPI0006E413D4|nr:hypothetical protein [Peterkaempfera griseoplana]
MKVSRDFSCTVGSTFKNCSTTISVKPGESLLVSVNGDGDVTSGDFRARKAGKTLRQVSDVSSDDADSTLVWTNDSHASVSVQMQVKSSDKGTINGTFQTES